MTTSRKQTGRLAAASTVSPIATLIGWPSYVSSSRRFTQGPASITLRGDRAELLTSATTSLYSYACTEPAASRWTITLHAGARLDHTAADALFEGGATHDIGPQLRARSITVPGGMAFWIRHLAALVQVDHLTETITAHCPTLDAGTSLATRLVRQVMTAQLLDHNAIYAHAAALVHNHHGLLIAGPKGAGKTTMLLSVLRLMGGDFVANDRLLLRRDNGATVGYAWPTHLRATVSTLRAVPGMNRFLPHDDKTTRAIQTRSKVAIEPAGLRQVLPATRILGEVRPTLMIWPYRSTHDTRPERVPADEVRDVLVRTEFFMHDPVTGTTSHRNHWLLPPTASECTAASLADLAVQVAQTVPCIRVPVTDSPAALARRVAALLAQHAPTTGLSGDPQ